jgi:multiple sugar transport system ATP-binding protein
VLVGPSGCGKTTALRMLAGFEPITAGEIRIGGDRVNEVQPRDRDIAMVFQNYALYPHMNVYDNIGYGLRVRRVPKAERAARIERASTMLGLNDELKRKPSQLSGGQRQRVAMGRAIVRQPRAFLMDEPLSNLDARLRVKMRTEIAALQRELAVTTVYVTHDQVEALTMADRVAVMRTGVLQQLDTPQRVYANPTNLFVATFIGSPAMNLLEGQLSTQNGHLECRIGAYSLAVPDPVIAAHSGLVRASGETIAVGVRPDAISVLPPDRDGLPGTVAVSEELGSEIILHIEVAAAPVTHAAVVDGLADETSAPVASRLAGTGPSSMTIVARVDAEGSLPRGTQVALAIDPNKMHFFSLDDGSTFRTSPTEAPARTMWPAFEHGQAPTAAG